MPAAKLKITTNDVQLYLLNELEEEKADYISKIDSQNSRDLKLKMDREIKSALSKIRRVDVMLQSAADRSYEMPASLESKISSMIAAKEINQKKTSQTFSEKFSSYFSTINVWSFAGGGAVASLCMIAVFQIQPDLLIGPTAIGDRAAENTEINTRFRGIPQREILSRVIEEPCEQMLHEKWVTTTEMLIQIPICEASEVIVSPTEFLLEDKKVRVGQGFYINILPLKDVRLTVKYRNQYGVESDLLSKEKVFNGNVISVRNGQRPYWFSEPVGRDKIIFSTSSGFEHSISFNVE